jgi:hypothetical protein
VRQGAERGGERLGWRRGLGNIAAALVTNKPAARSDVAQFFLF